MLPIPQRRFTIADGMILVVASAVAMLLVRESVTWTFATPQQPSAYRLIFVVEGILECGTAPVMLALIPIRLRRPRPGRIRLFRQPGFAACCAFGAVQAVGLIQVLLLVQFLDGGGALQFQPLWSSVNPLYSGHAVAGSWAILVLSGRWKAERSWIDRTARFCGATWILMIGFQTCMFSIMRYLPAI